MQDRLDESNIPPEVIQAAQTLHNYFAKQGANKWQLMDVCSRNYADENEERKKLLASTHFSMEDLFQ